MESFSPDASKIALLANQRLMTCSASAIAESAVERERGAAGTVDAGAVISREA
jgi:hypothetical protein